MSFATLKTSLASAGQRGLWSFELLLERRLLLFIIGDLLLLVGGLIDAWVGGGSPYLVYLRIVLLPPLILMPPLLAGVVALERRAGSLDLALAVASTERYFLHRVLSVCLFFILQGWLVIGLAQVSWATLRAMVLSAEVCLVMGAVTLFWAVRLATSGAVLGATFMTLALLSPWIFIDPFPATWIGPPPTFLGIPQHVLVWAWNAFFLATVAVTFYLYARRRLRRPESLLF